MSRTHLLGAASAAALACFTAGAHAQSTIQGGGSTLAQFDYIAEYNSFAATAPAATFGSYWEAGSGSGQNAFLYDDLSCDINKVNNVVQTFAGKLVTGACTGAASGPGTGAGQGGNTVAYGASDATLSNGLAPNPGNANGATPQTTFWTTYTLGQAAAGNLIQLPSMGVGISLPVVNSAVKNNGDLSLSDKDLCEIFSGGYTDFSQITDAVNLSKAKGKYAPGPIQVVYRSDGSGTSFILTDHLAKVCTSADTAAGFTFSATTTFSSLFANGFPAGSHFVGGKGSNGVAAILEPASGTAAPSVAYLSPDFTSFVQAPGVTINGAPSTILIASAITGNTPYLPSTANITTGLAKAVSGYNLTAPTTAAQGANPSSWVPLIQTVKAGYPIVGYTTYDFAQCYADPNVALGIRQFLKGHYSVPGAATFGASVQASNGFVGIANSGAASFLKQIENHILNNVGTKAVPAWNVDIQDATACAGLTGR